MNSAIKLIVGIIVVLAGLYWYAADFVGRNVWTGVIGSSAIGAFKTVFVGLFGIFLIFIGFLYSPLSRLLSILVNMLSRKFEYEADEFSARTSGHPEILATALKKLSVDNLSHLTPHPLKVLLEYSHPPVLKRIEALRSPRT